MVMSKWVGVACMAFALGNGVAHAAEPMQKTVEALNMERTQLKGQLVQFKGKVVKVNNGIMKKNFLHVQDGTGKQGTNDVTITSAQTAQVGDEIVVVGTVVNDRDFGAGYTYPLLVEDAKITAAK